MARFHMKWEGELSCFERPRIILWPTSIGFSLSFLTENGVTERSRSFALSATIAFAPDENDLLRL